MTAKAITSCEDEKQGQKTEQKGEAWRFTFI